MPLANAAFCVAARNLDSMQVFLLPGATAAECENRLRGHGELIGGATLQAGHQLSSSEIQALNLQEDEIRQWL